MKQTTEPRPKLAEDPSLLPVARAQTWRGEPVRIINVCGAWGFIENAKIEGFVTVKSPPNVHPFARASLPPVYAQSTISGLTRLAVYSEILTFDHLRGRLEQLLDTDDSEATLVVEYEGQLVPIIGMALYGACRLILIPAGESISVEAGQPSREAANEQLVRERDGLFEALESGWTLGMYRWAQKHPDKVRNPYGEEVEENPLADDL